jgi:2-dehydro-3-deoxy-D-arabinonate dehydratase
MSMNVTHICRFTAPDGSPQVGVVAGDNVYALPGAVFAELVLHLEDAPDATYDELEAATGTPAVCSWAALETGTAAGYRLLVPLDEQEVWAAGVTYQRSAQAREDESQQSGIYDRVYAAERPELFFKATASRTAGSGEAVYIRSDARWNVPEPELALLVGPRGTILGYSAGNDVSSRDIEGANPLYLPQAKVYARCCGLGPAIRLRRDGPDAQNLPIRLQIERGGAVVFSGETSTARMKRMPEELVRYLMLDNTFPNGAYLLTGTGIVPGDDVTLEAGDDVTITIDGIGALRNRVERAPGAGI